MLALLMAAASAASCTAKDPAPAVQAEIDLRDGFAKAAAIDGGAGRALNVGSRSDVLFEDGFSLVSYDPPDDFRNHAFRWMGARGHVRLKSHGDTTMELELYGYLNEKVIRSKPAITIYVDGVRLFDTHVEEDGSWIIKTKIPAEWARNTRWMDLIITVSAVGFFWAEPPELRVVVVNKVRWAEQGAPP